jgi:hypothetical protein
MLGIDCEEERFGTGQTHLAHQHDRVFIGELLYQRQQRCFGFFLLVPENAMYTCAGRTN